MAKDKGTHYHNKPALALRYGVSTRSIDRWIEIGRFSAARSSAPEWAATLAQRDY